MTVPLRLDDIHVTLGGNEVLRGVCMDVAAGRFITLLGPSGSGKSTTLNVIAGLMRPDSGRVRFGDRDVTNLEPHDRDIGMVFQSYALFPHMTVAENVAFPLLTRRRPKRERRATAQRMLELVRLADMGDRTPAALSGGQRQRVALARALAAEPGLLLLDEPLAALDRQLREAMQLEIKRVQAEVGVTTIAVTHDQAEALTISDRVAIMANGEIVQYGTPEELYQRPASAFVATFLGEANLIPVPGGLAVLRPEDLRLANGSGATHEGVLRSKTFQGSRFRLEVEHATLGTLIVSLPPQADTSGVAQGDTIGLDCRTETAHILTDAVSETL
ncbi:ABC transporter ATP-binding protein [Nocardia miyunensis]|uniref:ABC transporter ATP-binding protein n=1 Tax=Nocardia miyunensis TaxID=282684 RepID=UPI0008303A1F|nr:ABC transporter ATP-binding protein [Nocardia miyunensis]